MEELDEQSSYSRQSSTATQNGSGWFWKQFFRQQFHYSKFCTCHQDWRLFVHSPWLPQKWTYQLAYIIYRVTIAAYFVCWFIASAVVADVLHDTKYPIYITYWSFVLLIIYLIFAAISTTGRYVQEHYFKRSLIQELQPTDLLDPSLFLQNCCGCGRNGISIPWYLQLQWILFVLTAQSSLLISVVYWMTFDGEIYSWPVNLHEHLFVILPGLIDLFISGTPVRIYQFIYMMIFTSTYFIFTGIYYAAGGTNTDGKPYIYSALNFRDRPVFSSFGVILLSTVVPLILHLIYWGLYLIRTLILTCILKQRAPEFDRNNSHDSHIGLATNNA